ncbi:MAG: hypothetical protein M1831_007465 [Alyxoria varia]|nr:MAG: hypothetical protein M1831_007465 [Alyxoria varia]
MSTLVGYSSSDNEAEEQPHQHREKESRLKRLKLGLVVKQIDLVRVKINFLMSTPNPIYLDGTSELQASTASNQGIEQSSRHQHAASSGSPTLGPSAGPAVQPRQKVESADQYDGEPATIQQLLHSLTLPPIPNVSIPPSPTGSPLPSATAKVNRFLDLKAKGVHFNDKLSSSAKIRNPNLLPSLMEFAGINQQYDQYASTLPEDVAAIPKHGFPKEAYVEELGKKQQELSTKRAEENKKLGGLEFVSSGSVQGQQVPDTSAGPAFRGLASSGKGSAAERVMAGLNTSRTATPSVSGSVEQTRSSTSRKTRFDDRGR